MINVTRTSQRGRPPKFDEYTKDEIAMKYNLGENMCSLAREYRTTRQTVKKILDERRG